MADFTFPDVTLTRGAHGKTEGFCARELLHYAILGTKADKTPECLTETLSMLPLLNDGGWRDDAHRTVVIMPFLPRVALCFRNAAIDQMLAFQLADYSIRVIAAEALDAAGMADYAVKLRAATPVVDDKTAWEAARVGGAAWEAVGVGGAVRAAAGAAAGAARAAAWKAAAEAAAEAADAAAEAALAAAEAALAAGGVEAAIIERHTRAMLGIICSAHVV